MRLDGGLRGLPSFLHVGGSFLHSKRLPVPSFSSPFATRSIHPPCRPSIRLPRGTVRRSRIDRAAMSVVRSIAPGGWMREYIECAELGVVVGANLFVHGGWVHLICLHPLLRPRAVRHELDMYQRPFRALFVQARVA